MSGALASRVTRLALGGALLLGAAPLTAPAQAWACLDPVTKAACFVVGTTCRAYGTVTGSTEICQLG